MTVQTILHGQILETVTCTKYLGVDISSDLSWRSHIDRITGRPQLEYAAAIRNPHTKDKSNQVEKVQRRAARWVSCNFVRLASVSDMIETLGWRSLQQRRADARLCLFYKIIHGLIALPLPDYIQPNSRISRYCHSMTFRQMHTSRDYYK